MSACPPTRTGEVVLYGIVHLVICDLRETVFPGMPRRAVWLCP